MTDPLKFHTLKTAENNCCQSYLVQINTAPLLEVPIDLDAVLRGRAGQNPYWKDAKQEEKGQKQGKIAKIPVVETQNSLKRSLLTVKRVFWPINPFQKYHFQLKMG